MRMPRRAQNLSGMFGIALAPGRILHQRSFRLFAGDAIQLLRSTVTVSM